MHLFVLNNFPSEKLIVSEVKLSVSKDARCWRWRRLDSLRDALTEPSPNRKHLSFETALGHVNCARRPRLKFVARSGGSSGACVPLSPFVPRPFVGSFVGFVRSLRSRSAPVVEVDAKVGVLSREKGVSRAPVSPPSSPGPPSDPEFPPRAHALPAARG